MSAAPRELAPGTWLTFAIQKAGATGVVVPPGCISVRFLD
ncbi:uncharacterized protein SOCE26_052820 [Sorangium cellulosum]|uniref:Uncharacterized protein n=1 Tax=Sorangium cellulosum TaxID=56 RepID=A0A2L0EX03_SORCE|nr:uncharacterized protein SOCE26_052820 [Sorangium cellulosum]